MDKSIIILQKNFKKKLLYKKIKEIDIFNKIFLIITENYDKKQNIEELEIEFDEITKLLRDNLLIKKVQNIINYYYKIYPEDILVAKKINARELLSSFIMYGYPEILLDVNRININDIIDTNIYEIYYFSKLLVINLIDFINSDYNNDKLRKFVKSINIYSNTFNIFIYQDKIKQINKVTHEHYQINKTLKEIKNSNSYSIEDKEIICEKMERTLNNLKEMLIIICPKYNLNNLLFYEEILEKFENTLYQTYWKKFKDEINQEKINNQIDIIYYSFKSFGVKKINNKIEVIFDYKDNYNDFEKWIEFCGICKDIILELQTLSRKEYTLILFHNIKYDYYEKIEDLIIKIFEFIMKENEIIFKDIYNTKVMINLGINPFVKK